MTRRIELTLSFSEVSCVTCQLLCLQVTTQKLPVLHCPLMAVAGPMQARCRGELFIECSRLDDKVPISHEEQMSTLRKVRPVHLRSSHHVTGLHVLFLQLSMRLMDVYLPETWLRWVGCAKTWVTNALCCELYTCFGRI